MRKQSLLLLLLCIAMSFYAHALSNFDYTGIAFNASGNILSSATVNVNVKLINSSGVQYEENHTGVATDQFGAYTVLVGSGTVVQGSLGLVSASKDLKIKTTVNSGGVWVVSTILKPTVALTSGSSELYWKLAGNAGTTAGTDFLGTSDNTELELRVDDNAGTYFNSLFIGTNNEIWRNGSSATVAGNARGSNSVDLQSSRTNSTQVASGDYSVIGGGRNNRALNIYSTVSGGRGIRASGDYSTVGGGRGNHATAEYSTAAGGYSALADKYGQNAYASGGFAVLGDAQTSVFILRNTTSAAGWTNLYLDGTSQNISLSSSATWTFNIIVVGKQTGGTSNGAGYEIKGVVTNNGGTLAFIGTPIVTTLGESNPNYDARVFLSGTNIIVQVEGNGDALRWVARMETVEVTW